MNDAAEDQFDDMYLDKALYIYFYGFQATQEIGVI